VPVDTSVYQNQPNPLGTLTGVYGVLNANQQLQLGQQAQQIRQFELDQAQANDLRSSVGPLANVPGVSRAEVLATMAQRARQMNMNPRVYNQAAQPFMDSNLSGDALQKALTIQGVGAAGPASLTARQNVVEPNTGAVTSVPAPQAYGKPVGAGLSPEQQAASQAAGTTAGGSLGQARVISSNLQNSTYGLKQAIQALEKLGPSGSGPGTKELNYIKSFLVTSGAAKTLGIDPESVTDYQVANKYLNDWARQSGDTSTNAKLEASQESNPNMSLAQQTNLKVARTALGLTRMKYMQQQEFDQTGLPPNQFPQWVAKNWTVKHDPTVFIFDQMSQQHRKQYLNSLPTSKQELFLLDLGRAEKAGAIDLE